jgi:hypothetical protein
MEFRGGELEAGGGFFTDQSARGLRIQRGNNTRVVSQAAHTMPCDSPPGRAEGGDGDVDGDDEMYPSG